jgi:divalent metal cation (Fe/Co/Zn/Cd) transporter
MIDLSENILIASDISAGGGALLDLYFDPVQGTVVEDKTTCEGTRLVAELPVGKALDDLTSEQIIAVAEAILCNCSREHEPRTMTEGNKSAFDKLVAEIHYDIHEIHEIKEAIEDYY